MKFTSLPIQAIVVVATIASVSFGSVAAIESTDKTACVNAGKTFLGGLCYEVGEIECPGGVDCWQALDGDRKCPFSDPNRLFRIPAQSETNDDNRVTFDECFQACVDAAGCSHFSYGEFLVGGQMRKVCMGCTDEQGNSEFDSTAPEGNSQDFTVFRMTDVNGDPHFRTWHNEHFEFHGQCDLVMTKVQNFGNKQGNELEIQLRTSMVRYWSYVKSVAIRIGNDILEVEGSAAKEDGIAKRHYHINFEHLGLLNELGGYPVTISPRNNKYIIDLDQDYPGQKIEISTFKEFVGVKVVGANENSFGNAVGIMGDYKTGKTLARDGSTVLNDFNELGLEWQVLPSDGKLFHEAAKPQFPELCYLPEDPRGDRARRLAESEVTEEAAEAACANLKDEFDRKGCVYDILATQDMEMVGAY
ncbi:unnamed protein product [Cylindrotheca closterium]|uniref:VWFD domain-containing protein n=1 Tax=Cylindrotheca closterium TaxID=2856 RepID=A0AAD2G8Q7_9STRA|nr:unnamed protein product [Cylindrotheca closterium]